MIKTIKAYWPVVTAAFAVATWCAWVSMSLNGINQTVNQIDERICFHSHAGDSVVFKSKPLVTTLPKVTQ
jgi:hypothetical protein